MYIFHIIPFYEQVEPSQFVLLAWLNPNTHGCRHFSLWHSITPCDLMRYQGHLSLKLRAQETGLWNLHQKGLDKYYQFGSQEFTAQ